MASIDIFFGAETHMRLTGEQAELTRALRQGIAQLLADRHLPCKLSKAGNERYAWAVVEFVTNLLHGTNPRMEISELPDGRVTFYGVDEESPCDQRPEAGIEESEDCCYVFTFHTCMGQTILRAIDRGYREEVVGSTHYSTLTIDPGAILTNVA